jgi:hypothetical protein
VTLIRTGRDWGHHSKYNWNYRVKINVRGDNSE